VSSAAKTRELTVAEGGGGLNVDHTSRQSAVFLFACGVAFVASVTATVYFCRSMYCEMEMPGGWTMSMMWMRMPGQTWFGSALSFHFMWLAMMVAMMLPSALPTFLKQRRTPASLSVMATGYFAAWMALGVGIYAHGVAFAAGAMRSQGFSPAVLVLFGASLSAAERFQFPRRNPARRRRCGSGVGCQTVSPDRQS